MKQKSEITAMPIIDGNENLYQDCVKILNTYCEWVVEIYSKAGVIKSMPKEAENPVIPETAIARPGQPGAHITHADENMDIKVCASGDQLTRARFAGAKDLRAGAHTARDRFEFCAPFGPVMWHTKASLLQYCFHLMFKPSSVNEVGTLKFFREKYNRKNVTPAKVLDSYTGCEELFISAGKGYLVAALMKFFGMATVDDIPTSHKFSMNDKDDFAKEFGLFVETFIFQWKLPTHTEEDNIMNYGLCMCFLTVLLLQMKDTAAQGDGDRNLINQKLLLSVFKSLGAFSKYAIEMFVSIAQIEALLTPRLSEQFKWGFYVNWKGGEGNNIEDDLAQEIMNRIVKDIVNHMGANKTVPSITKVCKAASGIHEIVTNADANFLNIHETSSKHTIRSAADDERGMIDDILSLDVFQYHASRCHPSFPDIKRSPMRYMKIVDFHKWIDKQLSYLTQ